MLPCLCSYNATRPASLYYSTALVPAAQL
jgi:hypothetical protein